jgi:hypothetical protein
MICVLGYNWASSVAPGCFMRSHLYSVGYGLLAITLSFSSAALAKDTPAPKISRQTREEIIHAFNDELVYIRTMFPMGKTGLKLRDGTITPNGPELQQLMSLWGPAVKPGDRARISSILIKDNCIHLEINGGPVKKPKWYQRIEVGGAMGGGPIAPSDASANARGSFVDLYFDKYVPEITGPELKELLRPVFDFDAKTALEAYLETVPPQVKEAISNHHVLVGMNHEMVIYAKGRPPRKLRERAPGAVEDVDFEEWIYGTPPQDVDFIRFVDDEVVRVETMKVDGQKIVRVNKEIDLGAAELAKKQEARPANAPTLRRPGEEMPDSNPATGPSSVPPVAPQPTGGNGPDYEWSRLPAPALW